MERLNLHPPLLIFTMGYPGAGKTYFSRQFAELHKLPCFSEERIRFELFENPQFNSDETEIIGRILDYSIEQIMKTGLSVVVDGDFSDKKSRERLKDLAKANKYRTLIVWVQTDMATAKTRASRRDRRNPDSKYAFNLETTTFDRIIASLERPHEKDAFVVLSGKNAFKGQSLTVLRKITEMYANALPSTQNRSGAGSAAPARTSRPFIR